MGLTDLHLPGAASRDRLRRGQPSHPQPGRRPARKLLAAAPFILPSLAGVILFLLLPVVVVLLLSFAKWNFLQPPSWAGLSNFVTMTRDDHVFHALLISAYYVLWNIPVQTVIALGLAMLLNRRLPGMGVYRALFVLPYMSTPVAMAVVWGWLFNAQNGMINHLLSLAGITGPNWLGDQATALPVIAMIATWQYAGYNMLFFLAGLQAIPLSLYEAASIDGGTKIQQFRRVTLPLLRPALMFVLVTGVIGSFQVFDTVYVMTAGGPGNATEVANLNIYNTAFAGFRIGEASAMSVVLFLIILVVAVAQFTYFNRRTTYEIA
jgi:multiple sugar transport system permease protein/sn-glycerol 3-phosphate transport system permease protein